VFATGCHLVVSYKLGDKLFGFVTRKISCCPIYYDICDPSRVGAWKVM